VPLYPRQHLLPDGKVFECGANQDSKMFDPATNAWFEVATTNLRANRDYGTSVLLPLSPANNYQPRVMILGGVTPNATNTTELIDLSVPQPVWVNGPNMSQARIQLNATILPNGKVLVSGGSSNDENGATASLETQLYDADANSFSPGSPMAFARLYHSNTLLLPDATVLAVGGNPVRTVYEPHIEIYSPPYLFNADGSPATRPVISAIDQAIRYGANFYIRTPYPADIKSVVMIRPGAVTHSFDMEQRLVHLSFTSSNGQLYVKAPPNGNIAPPGYYMVFILDSKGVPSKAAFVHLT
jgi:galactose oxidase